VLTIPLHDYAAGVGENLVPPDPGSLVVVVEYDEEWPREFARQEVRIRHALGPVATEVHHAGSTSVPGLAAKAIIDVVLVVPDTDDEAAYAPALRAAGFTFASRSPAWFGHRLFKDRSPRVNVHVFGPRCPEVDRMLAFRDHLRRDAADRDLYETTKRELAGRTWVLAQDYADAKSPVVEEIMSRAVR
jgi:GrpB-like predicted nucleotidyltransferase (UPF0157 family)